MIEQREVAWYFCPGCLIGWMVPFPGQRRAWAGRCGQLVWVLGEPSTYYVMSIVKPRPSSDNVPQSTWVYLEILSKLMVMARRVCCRHWELELTVDGLHNQDDESKDRIKWVGERAENCYKWWWAVTFGWAFSVIISVFCGWSTVIKRAQDSVGRGCDFLACLKQL